MAIHSNDVLKEFFRHLVPGFGKLTKKTAYLLPSRLIPIETVEDIHDIALKLFICLENAG